MSSIDLVGNTCTGCGACQNVCGKNCISMKYNAEGFAYPSVDYDTCVDCGKCLNICPAHHTPELQLGEQCMGVLSGLKEEIQNSASGGVFYTLGKWFIAQGGIVCGAVMGADKLVAHQCTDTIAGLRAMQDSKYVQSSTVDCYRQVKQHLKDGRKVLFSGTPCQVAGLYACVGKHDLLWTVDIVCHGVPSPVFLQNHIVSLEKKNKKTAERVQFRTKDQRNRTSFRLRLFQNDRCWYDAYYKEDLYYSLFMDGVSYRESCYVCAYARKERCADLTMGDLGSYRAYPDFHPHEATSTVVVNNERGCHLWEKVMQEFDVLDIRLEKEIQMNHQLSAPSKRPDLRDSIYSEIRELPEEEVYRRYCSRLSFREKLSLNIKQYLPIFIVKWIRNHS